MAAAGDSVVVVVVAAVVVVAESALVLQVSTESHQAVPVPGMALSQIVLQPV